MKGKTCFVALFSALLCFIANGQNSSPTNSAGQYFADAKSLAQAGKNEEARAAFAHGIDLQPGNFGAVMDQAGLFMQLGRPDDALKIWDKWIALKPDDPQRWLYKAIAAGESGRDEEALKATEKLTELQPNNADGWKARAQCLAGMGRNEEALQAINRAVILSPKDEDAWRTRMAVEPKLKEFNTSIGFANKLVAQNPASLGPVYDRAGLYALNGDKPHALADLKTALSIRSSDVKPFARQDERFKSLRDDPDFKKLVETVWNRTAPNITLKIVRVDSQETVGEDGKAANAVDGNPLTFWHTQWQGATPGLPHEIIIELDPPAKIKGFVYLPRQDSLENGTIKDYEFYVSNDGQNFGQPVKNGAFEPGKEMKTVTFEAQSCRYIKLKALSEVSGQSWTSAAEIDVIPE